MERDALVRRTLKQLLAIAKRLGLAGVTKLRKDALVARILEAAGAATRAARSEPTPAPAKAPSSSRPPGEPVLARVPAPAAAPAAPAASAPAPAAGEREEEREPAATAKLDLGPAASAAEKPGADIPWSYGEDRVTAMAVDPFKLFVYWEVTDPAIERARAQLGAGGAGAWLNLRVYDTSGLIFDGTNARSYFDHRVERHDRQWFFVVNKPSSTAYVELGLRSDEGYFARIGRSARIDFPRSEPVPLGEAEWLTVQVSTGEARHAGRSAASRPPPGPPGAEGGHHALPVYEPVDGGVAAGGEAVRVWQLLHGDGHRVEWRQLLGGAGWFELEGRVEWEGPLLVSSWEAGPFAYPVSVEPPSREEWEGRSFAYRVGDVTHVVYGPWQVVIRNLGAYRQHAELARWEVFRSWVAVAGREVRQALPAGGGVRTGASERLGASERRWVAGSELRLGGASEVWRLGASEVRMRGASETLFAGASQWVQRGASERRLLGGSEVRMRGASEQRLGGASERLLGGASEARLGGSEGRLGGSEHRLGAGAPEEAASTEAPAPLAYPKVEG